MIKRYLGNDPAMWALKSSDIFLGMYMFNTMQARR